MNLEKFLLEEFKYFHSNPELSNEEFQTTARLKKILSKYQIETLDLPLETGVVAKIGLGEKIFALRADIDALPIVEQTDLDYKSKVHGKMHACGHDFHLTAVLGAAILLKSIEKNLRGTVLIIFQPSEETPGGALKVLETGALENVQGIFGLHSSPLMEVGTLGISSGAIMASVDKFAIIFHGKSTHAAHPDRGIDPIIISANFITAAQSIVTRNLEPANANLLSITHIEGGNTWNVIPDSVCLEGTFRSFSAEDRQTIKSRLQTLAEKISDAFGGLAEVKFFADAPALVNDEQLIDFAKKISAEEDFKIQPAPKSLAGEDFAFYLEKIPGAFILVGTGKSESNHNPKFKVDPAAIYPTAKLLAKILERVLQN